MTERRATRHDDLLGPQTLRAYGCVRCQRWHYEGDELFEPHIWHQSKHGFKRLPASEVADLKELRHRADNGGVI